MPAWTEAQQLTPESGGPQPDAGRSWGRGGVRPGLLSSTPDSPCAHLAVLQEGEEPLQLGHQGLGVVLSQTEHTVSETSKQSEAPGVSQGHPKNLYSPILWQPKDSKLKAGQTPVAQIWARRQGRGAGEQLGSEMTPAVPSVLTAHDSTIRRFQCPKVLWSQGFKVGTLRHAPESMPISPPATHTLLPTSLRNGVQTRPEQHALLQPWPSRPTITAASQGPCHPKLSLCLQMVGGHCEEYAENRGQG